MCFACAQGVREFRDDGDDDAPWGIAETTPVRIVDGAFVVVGPTTVERVRKATFYPAGTYPPKAGGDDSDA
jgi:hypothetical protein